MGPKAGLEGCEKSRPPPGFDPRTVQPVASSYTDYAIPAHANTRSRYKQTVRDMYRSHGHVAEFAILMGRYAVSTCKRAADISIALESWHSHYVTISVSCYQTSGGGDAVAHLVEAQQYKPEGRGFDSGWCLSKFPLT